MENRLFIFLMLTLKSQEKIKKLVVAKKIASNDGMNVFGY